MKYVSFTILQYRGIQEPITFDIEKNRIIPLIGVNECGKTTILEAILCIDHFLDNANDGHHLRDMENLNVSKPGEPRVAARIAGVGEEFSEVTRELISQLHSSDDRELMRTYVQEPEGQKFGNEVLEREFKRMFADTEPDDEKVVDLLETLGRMQLLRDLAEQFDSRRDKEFKFDITRHLKQEKYTIEGLPVEVPEDIQHQFTRELFRYLDYLIYFDDFRHHVPESIPIKKASAWQGILNTLFKRADPDVNLADLPDMDPRHRRTAIAAAQGIMNEALTKQWRRFHLVLDENKTEEDNLEIEIDYHDEDEPSISFIVAETSATNKKMFFNVTDRSKGFFWFFNFVMRLEFNPKLGEDLNTIYLLDEPGSYLHAHAQDRLCEKLRELSNENCVIYCTHSHHLLNPITIPFNSIRIVDRIAGKTISVRTVFDHAQEALERYAAFQPIFEALQVRPSTFDMTTGRVLVVEGLYDFFAFEIFKQSDMTVVPAVNAHSIIYHLSWLMAWGIDYRALWDNDNEGRIQRKNATDHFGEEEATRRFKLLPLRPRGKKRVLQDLFVDDDMKMLKKELGLPLNTSFNKTILAFFYSDDRDKIKRKISKETKDGFRDVFNSLW